MTDTLAAELTAAVAPTPKEVDKLIVEYAAAQKVMLSAQTVSSVAAGAANKLKAQLTVMVETYGVRHTECSKRLEGIHGRATTTTGKTLSTDSTAVDTFKTYLDSSHMPDLVERFFTTHTSYSLVAAPDDVLKTLSLGTRIRDKMTSLLALCNKVGLRSPSLKVEYVEPTAPAKKGAK
jgi:hypothetical protein